MKNDDSGQMHLEVIEVSQGSHVTESRGAIHKVWAFLNRDVRTFFPRREAPESIQIAAPLPVPEISEDEFLFDEGKFNSMMERRSLLDWRDDFHVDLTTHANTAVKEFKSRLDARLEELGFFESLFPRPAQDVLRDDLAEIILNPIKNYLEVQEGKIRLRLEADDVIREIAPVFRTDALDRLNSAFIYLSFNRKQRDQILGKLDATLFGMRGGAVPDLRDQASKILMTMLQRYS